MVFLRSGNARDLSVFSSKGQPKKKEYSCSGRYRVVWKSSAVVLLVPYICVEYQMREKKQWKYSSNDKIENKFSR